MTAMRLGSMATLPPLALWTLTVQHPLAEFSLHLQSVDHLRVTLAIGVMLLMRRLPGVRLRTVVCVMSACLALLGMGRVGLAPIPRLLHAKPPVSLVLELQPLRHFITEATAPDRTQLACAIAIGLSLNCSRPMVPGFPLRQRGPPMLIGVHA